MLFFRRTCLLLLATALVSRATADEPSVSDSTDFASELPRIAATEPADTLANFQVVDGYALQLVAAEPLVASPVAVEWAADGRMFVCEMRGYSENRDDELSTIAMLTDQNGDGVYDSRTKFASGLKWPTAIFPYDDGLFVGDAPEILYFKDTDGDGVSDVRRTVLTGFGTSNVQGLLNSFRWGLDNRIHVACSSVGGNVKIAGSDATAVALRGRDIAFDPRTYEFELTSGAAQHGMCFDDWGRKFVSANSDHIMQVMYDDHALARNPFVQAPSARLSIAVDGPQAEVFRTSPVEPWRTVRTRLRVNGLVGGPVEGGGRASGYFTGATGVTIYRGDAWPLRDHGLAIVGDVGSNLVHRKRLQPRGLEFAALRIDVESEFVTSTDNWFRPAQFANAPDGTLYVIDVCREVIEHPKSLPPEIKRHLDLTAGRGRGRIYRIVPAGYQTRPPDNLAVATSQKLVSWLTHPNAWHRETAARLLFQRQDQAMVDAVRLLSRSSESAVGRLHALYVLSGLSAIEDDDLLHALADRHPQVRRHAIRLAESRSASPIIAAALSSLASDESIEVRYALAFAAAGFGMPDRIDCLADLIRHDIGDRWMQVAVQSSLLEGAGQMFAKLVADPGFRASAASRFLAKLAAQVRDQDDSAAAEIIIASLGNLPVTTAGFALPIIGEFRQGAARSETAIGRLARSGKLQLLDRRVSEMVQSIVDAAATEKVDSKAMPDMIRALRFGSEDQVVGTVGRFLSNQQTVQVQLAAVETLGRFSGSDAVQILLDAWQDSTPSVRRASAEVLFARPERIAALFAAVDDGRVALAELPASRLRQAKKSTNKELASHASRLVARLGTGTREQTVIAYRDVLTTSGDAAKGKVVFQKHCAACHRVDGVGTALGPNLAAMRARGRESILVNVLDPNREVNPAYLNYSVLSVDGRVVTGMIASENANSVTLTRGENTRDTILRRDIDVFRSSGVSLMPEDLDKAIDQEAMADLIEYLMQIE